MESYPPDRSALGAEEVRLTKEAYGWPTDEDFYVPDEVLEHFRDVKERGREQEEEWNARAARYREAHPDLWAELELIMDRRLPENWDADVPTFSPGDGPNRIDHRGGRRSLEDVAEHAAAHAGPVGQPAQSEFPRLFRPDCVRDGRRGSRGPSPAVRTRNPDRADRHA